MELNKPPTRAPSSYGTQYIEHATHATVVPLTAGECYQTIVDMLADFHIMKILLKIIFDLNEIPTLVFSAGRHYSARTAV